MNGVPTLSELRAARSASLQEGNLPARARSTDLDAVLADLIGATMGDAGIGVAAVGGYGRGELWPHSDIDLLFVAAPRSRVTPATVRGLLYPLWDANWQVGHAVRTAKEAIDNASRDLHAATALLTSRFIGGERALYDELIDRRDRWVARDSRRLVGRIMAEVAGRHARVDRAGWSLAPDLKEDIGGFRDLHSLTWIAAITRERTNDPRLDAASEYLGAVREALHAEVAHKTDVMRLDLQPRVAKRLGLGGSEGTDRLMSGVHSKARDVEHITRRALRSAGSPATGGPRRSGTLSSLGHGVALDEGVLTFSEPPGPGTVMWLLAEHAASGKDVAPGAIGAAERAMSKVDPGAWPECLEPFLALLRGRHAPSALELLDHTGGLVALIPEWVRIRGRAQHDLYHRYTVDGHSFIAVAEVGRVIDGDPVAKAAAEAAGDLDTLFLAALLHDIGKGSGEDHSGVGSLSAGAACRRMGLSEDDVQEVSRLVLLHLLLPDTATRRDIDDGAVVSAVADRVGSLRTLKLLYLLAAADGWATGPEAWTDWKAALVASLYRKVLVALETGKIPVRVDVTVKAGEIEALEPSVAGRAEAILSTLPPSYLDSAPIENISDEVRMLSEPLGPGEVRTRIGQEELSGRVLLTVCVPDRPGTLARTAGVLALHRVSVLSAQAFSTTAGMALERFVLEERGSSWDDILETLGAVYSGRLALDAHLERKAADYRPALPIDPEVRILQDEASHSTVIEVRAPDALGLLYATTAGLSDLDLDIHVAKIDTLGERVVDVFYVRTPWGTKIDDRQAAEVERSIRHRAARLFGPPTP